MRHLRSYRYQDGDKLADLEEATRRASKNRSVVSWTLAKHLRYRYAVSGRVEDLDLSIERSETALQTLRSNSAFQHDCLESIGGALNVL
ncbi:uncharacterized protein BDV17DRAFT_259479 [Aspergillus undulatus]|uniref:uncharacterized protein n=1 Tax=Aspergillus undulatus TaxID=1810928 RepID=UPI003CCD9542